MCQVQEEKKQGKISVQETINLLTSEEKLEVCDESYLRFNDYEILPPFYDEEKFKKGQQFYHKHIFGMFFGKLLGLLTVISTPSIYKILSFTGMSNEPMTAYKRYMSTIFHMCVWYDNDFKPGSKLWRSIATVKTLHNTASKRCNVAIGSRIRQKEMGITQFGFMGLAVLHPEKVGIHNASKEELENFIHLWKVIGYIMGIDDRYNICKDSVDETKDICQALIDHIFVPNLKNEDPTYLRLAYALITGMWVMQPFLEFNTAMAVMYNILNTNVNNNNAKLPKKPLTKLQQIHLFLMEWYISIINYTIMRWIANGLQYLSFWLMKNFPFLALYKFGSENSYVTIYIRREKKI